MIIFFTNIAQDCSRFFANIAQNCQLCKANFRPKDLHISSSIPFLLISSNISMARGCPTLKNRSQLEKAVRQSDSILFVDILVELTNNSIRWQDPRIVTDTEARCLVLKSTASNWLHPVCRYVQICICSICQFNQFYYRYRDDCAVYTASKWLHPVCRQPFFLPLPQHL